MKEIKQIESFAVDHNYIMPGFYVSRRDGDITTYDLRTRRPNHGDYMDNLTMHSVEHMLATLLRSSALSDKVIYFGPMGCQTGFYLLMQSATDVEAYELVKAALADVLTETEMYGNTQKECGNYKNLSLDAAKKECAAYLSALCSRKKIKGMDFSYDKGE